MTTFAIVFMLALYAAVMGTTVIYLRLHPGAQRRRPH
jgi:hypothetical protein